MKEKQIEIYLRDQVKKIGGVAYKFISPGNDGVPDRLVCLPHGVTAFVELKAPGKTPRPLQQLQLKKLMGLHQNVFVIDSLELTDIFIDWAVREVEIRTTGVSEILH